jgi:hypothetical protein
MKAAQHNYFDTKTTELFINLEDLRHCQYSTVMKIILTVKQHRHLQDERGLGSELFITVIKLTIQTNLFSNKVCL